MSANEMATPAHKDSVNKTEETKQSKPHANPFPVPSDSKSFQTASSCRISSPSLRRSYSRFRSTSHFDYSSCHTVSFLETSHENHPQCREGIFGQAEEPENPVSGKNGSAVDAEDQVGNTIVTNRGLLFLHDQFQSEDQREDTANGAREDTSETGANRQDVTPSKNRLPFNQRMTSHGGSPVNDARTKPSSFRRTPGASRPNNPSHNQPPTSNLHQSFWGPDRNARMYGAPSAMLSAADLCRPSASNMNDDHIMEMSTVDQLGSVRLMVSNLDYNISAREWKKILIAEFQQHVQVLGVYMQTQADNTNIGYVRVPTIDEARYAISQFHRKKIGYKRIHVSLINHDANTTATNSRSEVVALLKEVTGNSLPLFKFIEIFEKRYHRGISVSELYRMRETIEIEEQGGAGRTVSLVAASHPSPSNSDMHDHEADYLESPVCKLHCQEGSAGYVSAMDAACLPNVIIQLRTFSAKVHTLLQTHEGSMPLISFQCCYEAEFQAMVALSEGGVPLEHLISCVPGVKVAISRSGVKKIQWAENKPPPVMDVGRSMPSPLMTQQLSQFSREVIDLLKHSPQCRMSFSKFIPAYHHHFGRQCRVADYGYTKLMELFEAIPHIVQIIGGGSRRFVTMSHRAHVKRFSSDLLRVLKSQASKQINVMDLPIVYNKVIAKPFDIHNYGVCFIEDMLSELPETTVLVNGVSQEMTISIPRREQTLEEGERTKQFAVEVIDLLRHSPQCRMPFNKFIPAYHHHFGKQCRVADYGFAKLIELFESIPHILRIEDEADDKMLCLTEQELIRVLEDQVTSLLRSYSDNQLPVPEFLTAFMRYHGHSIRLQDYNVASVSELIQQIPNIATVERVNGRATIRLVDHSRQQQLSVRILLMLMAQVDGTMKARQLLSQYQSRYDTTLTMEELLTDLQGIVKVTPDEFGCAAGGVVKLCALQMFARDVRTLLLAHKGKLTLQNFETAYAHHFGVSLVPASYGYPSLPALLQTIPHLATVRGKGYRRVVMLSQEFQVPSTGQEQTEQGGHDQTPVSPPSTGMPEGKANTPSNDSGITECQGDLSSSQSCDSPGLLQTPPGHQEGFHSPGFHTATSIPFDMFRQLADDPLRHSETPSTDMLQFAAQLLPTSVPHGPYPSQAHYPVTQVFDPFRPAPDQYGPQPGAQYPYVTPAMPAGGAAAAAYPFGLYSDGLKELRYEQPPLDAFSALQRQDSNKCISDATPTNREMAPPAGDYRFMTYTASSPQANSCPSGPFGTMLPVTAIEHYGPPPMFHMAYPYCPPSTSPHMMSCQDIEQDLNRLDATSSPTPAVSPAEAAFTGSQVVTGSQSARPTPPNTTNVNSMTTSIPKSLHTLASERILQSGMSMAISCRGPKCTYAEMLSTATRDCSALYLDPCPVQCAVTVPTSGSQQPCHGAAAEGSPSLRESPKKPRLAARFDIPVTAVDMKKTKV